MAGKKFVEERRVVKAQCEPNTSERVELRYCERCGALGLHPLPTLTAESPATHSMPGCAGCSEILRRLMGEVTP